MRHDGWRERLKQAAWWHPVGRAAMFAAAGVVGAAAVHRPGSGFDPTVGILASMGGWAMSLVRWPPTRKRH
jgi:hypothetical protein